MSDINDDEVGGGSSKSNSVNSLQSTGVSASSQVTIPPSFHAAKFENFREKTNGVCPNTSSCTFIFSYSGDLNNGLVWCSNGSNLSGS